MHWATSTLINLLNQYSVKTGTFELTSGKTSDFFIDCKPVLLTARGHLTAAEAILNVMKEQFKNAQLVAGVELGGCSLASATALFAEVNPRYKRINLPYNALYIRKTAKDHGTKNLIEGLFSPGQPTVLLEDVVTTGGSSLRALEVLHNAGLAPLGVIAIVDRQEGAQENFKSAGVPFFPIITREMLLEAREKENKDG